jgi:hypothetical protein
VVTPNLQGFFVVVNALERLSVSGFDPDGSTGQLSLMYQVKSEGDF